MPTCTPWPRVAGAATAVGGPQRLVPRYSGSGRYRPPPRWYARLQWLGFAMTWLGLSPRFVVTLEVPGRRSGAIRKTNLVLLDHDGEQYLVALAGKSEWVRTYLLRAGREPGSTKVIREARIYFGVRGGLTLAEIGSVADRYPVFRVLPRPELPGSRGRTRSLVGDSGTTTTTQADDEEVTVMRPEMPDWAALGRRIDGEVALPGSPAYQTRPAAFNARFRDVRPAAVVACASPEDVREAVAFAGRHGLELAARAGGHSFAGHSSTRGVLVDVTPMRSVTVGAGVASVGAGARLGEVYEALQAHDLTIPGGTCPPVGVAGLTLGGGLGILGRRYGVTADHLVGAEVVLADGRILRCDDHHEQDLFWALGGAGAGNFGVVTRLDFRPVPAPSATTNLHLAWPYDHAAAVIGAWQRWAPAGPDELAASLKVTAGDDPGRPPAVDVWGAFHGPQADAARLVGELVARVGADPATATLTPMTWPQTRRWWAALGDPAEDAEAPPAPGPSGEPCLYARSEFFARPLPAEAVGALLAAFGRDRAAGQSRELDFMPWGGAYNRRAADATAFVHRDQLFQLKHAAVVAAGATRASQAAAHRAATRSWASVHPWGSGRVFQNFADPDLEDWADAYYGANYPRLVGVKARYDPSDRFRFQQSLPVGR